MKNPRRIGLVGVVLMAIAVGITSLVIGVYFGAYNAEPIMGGIVDYQNGQITEKNAMISDYKALDREQKNQIGDLNDTVNEATDCYDTFIKNVDPVTVKKFKTCMERVV